MALKWYMGDFMTGQIDKGLALPVIDGSTSINHDVNGESSADIKIDRNGLPASLSNDWKIAFESYDKMIVCIDDNGTTENIVFGGFIYKNQIDIDSGDVLSIQARGILDYLRNRLMIPLFGNETDASKNITIEAPSWRSILIKLIKHAFSTNGIPSGAPRPPQILEDIDADEGDGVTLKTLYVDAYNYGDRLEDIRDNLSSKGQEFKFLPVWDGNSRTKLKFRLIVGSASNPHIGFGNTINIQLKKDGNTKITKFSSTSSGENKRNRFFIQSSNDEKKTDLTTKYTGGSNSVLVDDFFNSPVELTSEELSEQLNARSDDLNKEMVEISLTVVGESRKEWFDNLGKKMNITGFSNTTSAGHSTVVRIVEIGFDDTDVITVGVQTPAKRYPRLPKQRIAEQQRKNKKSSNLKNQKYYKGGNGSSKWKSTSLGNSGYGGGTGGDPGDGGGDGGDGGVDPVEPDETDPGQSSDWGTGGGNNGEDKPVKGKAKFAYNQISVTSSSYFTKGNTAIASNNTIWSCPTFLNFANSWDSSDDAQNLNEDSHKGVIYSGVLYSGGISDPGIATEFTILPADTKTIFQRAQGTVVPTKPGDFKSSDGVTIHDYRLKKSFGKSFGPVVLEDNNIYIPIVFGVTWGMRSKRDENITWTSGNDEGKTEGKNVEIESAFFCFLKLKINGMRDLDNYTISDKDFRGDVPYPSPQGVDYADYSFAKYGSWIIATENGSSFTEPILTSAANYNSSGSSLATWWGWSVQTENLSIGHNENDNPIAIYQNEPGKSGMEWMQLALRDFPVPKNNAVPLSWANYRDDFDHYQASGSKSFTCLGRLFFIEKKDNDNFKSDLIVSSLDCKDPLVDKIQRTNITTTPAEIQTYDKITQVLTSGRHVYVIVEGRIHYGRITEVEE